MLKASFAGYVKFPERKQTKSGKTYSSYMVKARAGKDEAGNPTYALLSCRDFRDEAPLPADASFVEVSGGLTTRVYKDKKGVDQVGLNVFVETYKVPPALQRNKEKEDDDGVPRWVKE